MFVFNAYSPFLFCMSLFISYKKYLPSEAVKKKRSDTLMLVQQCISKEIQEKFIGKTLKVIIDEPQKQEQNIYVGRSEYDAPEVDGIVYVRSRKKLMPGDFVLVRITDTYEYDLAGEVV